MSIADELAKLEELRRGGALSESEFARAKAALLNATAPPPGEQLGDHLSAQLEEVRFQNELAQIDREWEIEREQYMITDRYGRRHVPTTAGSAIVGMVVVGFGVVWTVVAFIMAQSGSRFLENHPGAGPAESIIPWVFPCFGVLFIIGGIAMSIYSHSKAKRYQQAFQAYQRRRAELLSRRGEHPDAGSPAGQ
jgi:hypothetical protein